jgi:Glyoxalase-like domain
MKLDHLVIAVPTLEMGAAWFFEQTGVTPVSGGKHALMGTHNLLVKLEGETYLELIAIDPEAPTPARARWFGLDTPPLAPRLIHWVARCENLETVQMPELGVVTPITRGDYAWKITIPNDGQLVLGGLLPTLIEWQSQHPTQHLPDSGVRLLHLQGAHPNPAETQAKLQTLGLEMPVQHGTPRLNAVLETPKGTVFF